MEGEQNILLHMIGGKDGEGNALRQRCDMPSPTLLDGWWTSEGRNQQSPGRDNNTLHGPM